MLDSRSHIASDETEVCDYPNHLYKYLTPSPSEFYITAQRESHDRVAVTSNRLSKSHQSINDDPEYFPVYNVKSSLKSSLLRSNRIDSRRPSIRSNKPKISQGKPSPTKSSIESKSFDLSNNRKLIDQNILDIPDIKLREHKNSESFLPDHFKIKTTSAGDVCVLRELLSPGVVS